MTAKPIDRRSVLSRHAVHRTAVDGESPLTVGNGEFCFTADVTGLQTFARWHSRAEARAEERSAMPLGTQSQWAYHWAPNPDGWELDDAMVEYERPDGSRARYPTDLDWRLSDAEARRLQPAGHYYWVNPQRLHLGHLGFLLTDPRTGRPVLTPSSLTDVDQRLDLWTGVLTSSFALGGLSTRTRTAVHPQRDLVAAEIESELFERGAASLRLSFAAVQDTWEAEEDPDRPDAHTTEVVIEGGLVHISRRVGSATYAVVVRARGATIRHSEPHAVDIEPTGARCEVVVEFLPRGPHAPLPTAEETFAAAAASWRDHWSVGAFLDLEGSDDPRAPELERRVVLSQYLTAIQCAGSLPPQESGLVCNSWGGTFHLEMHWWHAAHFALWGRPHLLERSLPWYSSILPAARENARRNGFPGARWPKHVGPEAIESPNEIGPLLVWQQPHPISYAELVYRAHGEDAAVLDRYGELVDETADFLAGFLWWEGETAHIAPPVMPAQERYDPARTWDPAFELAYFAWALETACTWRRRRGLAVPDAWSRAVAGIAPLPVSDVDTYAAVRGETAFIDHPSLLGAYGFVPPTRLVDPDRMARTLRLVLDAWEWDSVWGWDFPLMAMCATRLGLLGQALDLLLSPLPRNRYLSNGHNMQVPNRLPLYLPGNGGLLAAVAMIFTDESGAPREDLPDGWRARVEGFAPRP